MSNLEEDADVCDIRYAFFRIDLQDSTRLNSNCIRLCIYNLRIGIPIRRLLTIISEQHPLVRGFRIAPKVLNPVHSLYTIPRFFLPFISSRVYSDGPPSRILRALWDNGFSEVTYATRQTANGSGNRMPTYFSLRHLAPLENLNQQYLSVRTLAA